MEAHFEALEVHSVVFTAHLRAVCLVLEKEEDHSGVVEPQPELLRPNLVRGGLHTGLTMEPLKDYLVHGVQGWIERRNHTVLIF